MTNRNIFVSEPEEGAIETDLTNVRNFYMDFTSNEIITKNYMIGDKVKGRVRFKSRALESDRGKAITMVVLSFHNYNLKNREK